MTRKTDSCEPGQAESNLRLAADLIEQGEFLDALSPIEDAIEEDPEDMRGLFLFGHVMLESQKPGVAAHVFRRVAEAEPTRGQAWINLGKCYDDMGDYETAHRYFRKALDCDPHDRIAMGNLSSIHVKQNHPEDAIRWAQRVLKAYPDDKQCLLSLGMAKLQLGQWEGWKEFSIGVGYVPDRERRDYGVPLWDGSGEKVVVYGEQGIGDQIAMCEALRDMRCEVYLDIKKKITPLVCRSFGLVPYKNQEIDSAISLSELQAVLRTNGYSGEPYLRVDMDRVRAVRELRGDGRNIGISWTGGLPHTGAATRSTSLETFLPILQQDANFFCLEYKDRSEEIRHFERTHGIEIKDYPWLTQTADYDDTAALVACLDLVISVPQSVVHLAGAIGTPCWCVQTDRPHFMFGREGEKTPLYNSVKQYRRDKGWGVIQQIADDLRGDHVSDRCSLA